MAKSYRLSPPPVVGMVAAALAASVLFAGAAFAQSSPAPAMGPQGSDGSRDLPHDPGVRGGLAGAGGALPGLGTAETAFFNAALLRFMEVDTVAKGLGPRFNLDSCAGCHKQPAVGGTSPFPNPQVAVAKRDRNSVPSFITTDGPVREARFIRNPNGTPDGGVHDLFVITGRSDAGGCKISQPDFAEAIEQHNIIFRIPTPVFGLGQVENTPDINLEHVAAATGSLRQMSGISGSFNHSGNDGTITRFGWKAQNKSLLMFAGEAYNVEQGVTNELFPNEREDDPNCQFNPLPEDSTSLVAGSASDVSSDTVNFAAFMRLSAGPAPASPASPASTASTSSGQRAFSNVGCDLCHIPQHTTAPSIFTGQSSKAFSPFSDFQLHHMGVGLQDQIAQGQAEGDQFRTAPLWGVGQRIFFLHDGRTDDLLEAIMAHASTGSEANTVIGNFNALPASSKQDILNFLRSR